jgi:hypothetical protein
LIAAPINPPDEIAVLFIAIPQKAIPELSKGLLNKAGKETIIVDVGNYYPFRDGHIDELDNGLADSAWVEKQIGQPVIKAFNSIYRIPWRRRGALPEVEIVLLFRSPVTIPRRNKSSLNLLTLLSNLAG